MSNALFIPFIRRILALFYYFFNICELSKWNDEFKVCAFKSISFQLLMVCFHLNFVGLSSIYVSEICCWWKCGGRFNFARVSLDDTKSFSSYELHCQWRWISLALYLFVLPFFSLCFVLTVNNCTAVRAVVFGFHRQIYFLKPKVSFAVNYTWPSIGSCFVPV